MQAYLKAASSTSLYFFTLFQTQNIKLFLDFDLISNLSNAPLFGSSSMHKDFLFFLFSFFFFPFHGGVGVFLNVSLVFVSFIFVGLFAMNV